MKEKANKAKEKAAYPSIKKIKQKKYCKRKNGSVITSSKY